MMSLKALARALGGEVSGNHVAAPGPGHSPRDRSMSVWVGAGAGNGFRVHSHASDDWRRCRDYVARRLGIPGGPPPSRARPPAPGPDEARNRSRALALWNSAVPAQGTMVERYLAGRGLALPPGDAVIRFHPSALWRDAASNTVARMPTMVAVLRHIGCDEIMGVHRTALTPDCHKRDRRMLGTARATAVKLDEDAVVEAGLTIGEGIETCLAARQLGFRPCWALASAGAISSFPVLTGVESLTILREDDRTGANARAVSACADRWLAAGREVLTVRPIAGGDANDALERIQS